MDNLEIEVKAHDEIASMCFAAGIETPDGTSVGAVKNALAELARLRAERDELRAALEEIKGMYASAIQTGNYYLAVEYCFNIARAAISRTEVGHE